MTTAIKSGIWMDHSAAHIIEYSTGVMITKTMYSAFTHDGKTTAQGKNENLMHNKEQHQQSTFYKDLITVIKKYQDVLLFGPTTAKNELHNLIRADHSLDGIKIEVRSADMITDNEQHAFVKEYFEITTAENK
jgi:hypothetical protein